MNTDNVKITQIAQQAREASLRMTQATTEAKNNTLRIMADLLERNRTTILKANQKDMEQARNAHVPDALVKRLLFDDKKLDARIRCLHKIAALPDPVGEVIQRKRCENGLTLEKVRVPIGVILMIYEARPHVTVNAGSFCLKSGNACILRGGSEARHCNNLLGDLWHESLQTAGLPESAIQVTAGTHEDVHALLQENQHIDLVIPRGGKNLIKKVITCSRIPVLKHYEGICHVYIDTSADFENALSVALDSKCLMPEVCNAMETLLIHEDILPRIQEIITAFRAYGVEIRGCDQIRNVVSEISPATDTDWKTEYLDLIVSMRIVKNVEEAVSHINTYGSHHTDSIMAEDESAANHFLHSVDSGVVLHNASTMFCDGETLGMGAEIGISTDKIHARGPMGLEELCSYKTLLRGSGHTMGTFPLRQESAIEVAEA